mmetsp:Transcript_7661/g.18770  ORF Transcript_7661/g.18770 Transcript_7661/m.18770 type:complete len:391 (-) Transcript_7661:134-1306(-)
MDAITEEGKSDIDGELTIINSSRTVARSKTYILHRTEGKGRSHPIPKGGNDIDRKPPCFLCYVPKPVYWLVSCLEQNPCCEAFGRIGCYGHENYQVRRRILAFGLVANILSCLLSIVACFSLSTNFNNIVAGGFSKGLVYIPGADIPTSRIWIGLRAVAIRNFQGQALINRDYVEEDHVIEFDAFCDYVDQGLERYMDPDDCNACDEASGGLMTAVVMAALLTLPNICTDFLRMYPNYDLNCQKFFGSILNLLSMMSSLYAWAGYAKMCFKSFNDETEVALVDTSNATAMNLVSIISNPSFTIPTISLAFLWRPGNGLVCVVLATFLKIFDIVVMLMIPTPELAHNKLLQEEYEALYAEEKEEKESPQNAEEGSQPDPSAAEESAEVENR